MDRGSANNKFVMKKAPNQSVLYYIWRGGRGSNPRPSAWQADTLTNWATTAQSLFSTTMKGETWWVMTESNRRHSACKADALPTELITLNCIWRGGRGSNPRPSAWQADTLTNWATTAQSLFSTTMKGETWWVMTESNRRHSACKADALPTELITRFA